MQTKRILLAGGTGYLGAYALRELLGQEHLNDFFVEEVENIT